MAICCCCCSFVRSHHFARQLFALRCQNAQRYLANMLIDAFHILSEGSRNHPSTVKRMLIDGIIAIALVPQHQFITLWLKFYFSFGENLNNHQVLDNFFFKNFNPSVLVLLQLKIFTDEIWATIHLVKIFLLIKKSLPHNFEFEFKFEVVWLDFSLLIQFFSLSLLLGT